MRKFTNQWLKRLTAIGLIAGLMVSLAACGGAKNESDSSKDVKNLRIGYLNVMDDAQAILAKDADLYKNHGLNVQLQLFTSGTDLIKAIVGGQIDAGVLGFSNALAWLNKGADVKIIGGAQMGYHSMMVSKDSGIKDIKDLKGKVIASQKKGSTADIVLNGIAFADAGLTRQDVNLQYVSPAVSIQSLAAGKVDAAFVFEPYDTIARTTLGAQSIYEIGKVSPFPCMVVISSGKILKDDRDAVNRMLDAQKEAIDMLSSDPKKAAGFITKEFIKDPELKTPDGKSVNPEDVIAEAISHQTYNWKITDENINQMQNIADIMVKQGILKSKIDVKTGLDLTWQNNQK